MNIGEKIKKLRKESGLTQEDLAVCANTTKQTIHKYETGIITNIPAKKITLIAEKLNTTPAYLMGWEDKTPTCLNDKRLKKLINLYNQLNDDNKIKLVELAELYANSN